MTRFSVAVAALILALTSTASLAAPCAKDGPKTVNKTGSNCNGPGASCTKKLYFSVTLPPGKQFSRAECWAGIHPNDPDQMEQFSGCNTSIKWADFTDLKTGTNNNGNTTVSVTFRNWAGDYDRNAELRVFCE